MILYNGWCPELQTMVAMQGVVRLGGNVILYPYGWAFTLLEGVFFYDDQMFILVLARHPLCPLKGLRTGGYAPCACCVCVLLCKYACYRRGDCSVVVGRWLQVVLLLLESALYGGYPCCCCCCCFIVVSYC